MHINDTSSLHDILPLFYMAQKTMTNFISHAVKLLHPYITLMFSGSSKNTIISCQKTNVNEIGKKGKK